MTEPVDWEMDLKHCFEVEHSSGISQALVRLHQLIKGTYARFVIVAPTEKLAFRENKNRFKFISYEELEQHVKTVGAFISQSKGLFGDHYG